MDVHPKDSLEWVMAELDAQTRDEKALSTLPCLKKDGTIIYMDIKTTTATFNGKKCSIGFFTDVTERKKIEEERQKAAKLDSIGTLAGGIAHDFINLLTGILGNIQLADGYLLQNRADLAKGVLAEAEYASQRAKDLTQQLLTFSRGGAPVKKAVLIDKLIKESVTFTLRGSNVKPVFALPDNLWALEADEGQLNQVISNIVINADQAMPNGGIIRISARNIATGARQTLPLPEGKYVEIAIEDHGTGIPRSHFDKLFDPYFTTKHKGSGLGLATTYSIIKNHGGTITFESELGVGTTFHVYLPAAKEKVKKEKEIAAATPPLPRTQGRILVMDDENVVRMVLDRMLTGAGYEVELTKEGTEAVQKYAEAKESGKPFDAVILDLTVPGGMGGKQAMAELLEIDPGVNAIVSSGYANDPVMAEFKNYGFRGVVVKPYDAQQMQKTLHGILVGK
jgi:nitrogen-specific signal transduction histidine kinase/CheY-like chemotaxis protein